MTDNESVTNQKDDTLHYVMTDGSFILSRHEGWKEVKLGRVFKAKDNYAISPKRATVAHSTYTAHIGECDDFIEKFHPTIAHLSNIICIADGATWFWNWMSDSFPDAIQILDFYHGFEKICQWAVPTFKDKEKRDQWTTAMKELLLDDQVKEVIIQIQQMECRDDNLEKKQALLTYLDNNKHRMLYKTYLQKGYLIGSGAMEAAHRNVIQQRMKRSGQRWTIKGGQQVLNIRVKKLSGQWEHVQKLIRQAA